MSKRLTSYFKPGTKPARKGVYQTDSELGSYQHWNGRYWGCCSFTVDRAWGAQRLKSAYQSPRWRGLAYDPSQDSK